MPGAGTTAAQQLAADGTTVATFDADAIYDFRSRRPVLDIVDGRLTSLAWAELRLTAAKVADRDLLSSAGRNPTTAGVSWPPTWSRSRSALG